MSSICVNLDSIEEDTKKFKEKFEVYSYLWNQDPKGSFEQFLIDNEPKDDSNEQDESGG